MLNISQRKFKQFTFMNEGNEHSILITSGLFVSSTVHLNDTFPTVLITQHRMGDYKRFVNLFKHFTEISQILRTVTK